MTFKAVASACALGLGLVLATAADAQKDSAAQKLSPEAIAFEKGLHKQSGDVAIPAALAQMQHGVRSGNGVGQPAILGRRRAGYRV